MANFFKVLAAGLIWGHLALDTGSCVDLPQVGTHSFCVLKTQQEEEKE